MSETLVDKLRGIKKSRLCDEAAYRIEALETKLATLRSHLADFRDAILQERGALAESGITCDHINAVLSEFDDRFTPTIAADETPVILQRGNHKAAG
jgi:hypothetical protein